VFSTWWPLATSWLFMGLELPAVSAALARLPDPTISLAAYGGVIFPLALLIESPIIMLLSASTALSKDLRSHELVGRFMWSAGLGLHRAPCAGRRGRRSTTWWSATSSACPT
jgi:hypothetical protein